MSSKGLLICIILGSISQVLSTYCVPGTVYPHLDLGIWKNLPDVDEDRDMPAK